MATRSSAAQDNLALYAFLQGLTPDQLRQDVRFAMPQSLSQALREADRAEVVLSTRPFQQKAPAL